MSTATQRLEMALEQFMSRPQCKGGAKEELLEGELVVRSPNAKADHAFIVEKLREALRPLLEEGYFITNDSSVILRPDSMPALDLLATKTERFMQAVHAKSWLEGSPELAIEVASQSNRRLERKADIYLQHGAEQVWLVFPNRKVVMVCSAEGDSPVDKHEGESLDFHGVVILVADLFA